MFGPRGCQPLPTASSSAELYYPTSGSFAYTVSMTAPRSSHEATLLTNGEVLVTGGENWTYNAPTSPSNCRTSTKVVTSSAELFQ
jgi:hypothetical protein